MNPQKEILDIMRARGKAYEVRIEALTQAHARDEEMRRVNRWVITLGVFIAIIGTSLLRGLDATSSLLILGAAVGMHLASYYYITWKYTVPEMKRIDKMYPKPEKWEINS